MKIFTMLWNVRKWIMVWVLRKLKNLLKVKVVGYLPGKNFKTRFWIDKMVKHYFPIKICGLWCITQMILTTTYKLVMVVKTIMKLMGNHRNACLTNLVNHTLRSMVCHHGHTGCILTKLKLCVMFPLVVVLKLRRRCSRRTWWKKKMVFRLVIRMNRWCWWLKRVRLDTMVETLPKYQ